ncbi:SIMPL domain-containing protein [Granulicella paludicola]|uniref:SIMPL domain-containing protein n=1 Tax=Granulicella paludicola TaxID=474951 RepID=UPI0021E0DBD0|nr:SIMPL domain-containing protein [Granulicella paludicola]
MKTFRLTTALMLASALPLTAQQIQISKENKTIAITTSDEASALADTAIVNIGFTTYGKDQDATYADATKTSNAVIAAIAASGVKKDAIQSANQNLGPISPNNDDDKARYAQGMRFTFSQGWRITVRAEQASDVLHIAILNGANNSGDISWELVHDDALEAEAAGKALEHARQIADQMAKGLNTKLGPLVYASNQTPPRGIFANMGFGNVSLNTESAAMSVRMKNLKPLAISPERITKSATVYAVFAIE